MIGMVSGEKTTLLEFLGDSPLSRILDCLIERRPFDTSKEEIIKGTGISRKSFFKVWKLVEKYDLVKETRIVDKSHMFVLNDTNEIVQKFLALETILIKKAMEIASAIKSENNFSEQEVEI